ncbi:zinc-dependent alcohol dehydrogenase family protein [Janthinobacterium sp. GW460P]|uniref:zinc-dependent alcohol dehydrogenase family protein n=1 Tax=unclassified Janthinobacterium TaxID=2610881 RepID=UPI000A32381B|nr:MULTISPECIES: zinc-dependent alcohol dehydrogenase family protein [unclassified Janthinobacterium]MCC7704737.1 zinc-dependent alcohol dehydrogenase family protein [Janthinobacterium sp. GW460P]MCC7710239.1 zinc-dependent alcohol dehydrogenase family protein [Janthinobacterium sp. GW460W]
MQALILTSFATPMTIENLPMPQPGPGQVLVRIAASGVNPLDTKIAAGAAPHARPRLPAILGIDVAGAVAAVGDGVDTFHVGETVYGMAGGIGGIQGSLAEYGVFDAALLAPVPQGLSMREAAALPLVFITAWEGLVDRARVQAGDTVLVHGGAGGVGSMAVQIAVALGATVYTTGSAASRAAIEALGARFIDYRSSTVDDYVAEHTGGAGFDIVYDTVGGATLDASFKAARMYGGHVVSCLGWGSYALTPLTARAATYSGVFTLLPLLSGENHARHGAILREANKLIAAGKLNVRLDPRRFSLGTVHEAHVAQMDGSARGKLVVDVAD